MPLFKVSDEAEQHFKEAKRYSDPGKEEFGLDVAIHHLEVAVALKPDKEKYRKELERTRGLKSKSSLKFVAEVDESFKTEGGDAIVLGTIQQGTIQEGEEVEIKTGGIGGKGRGVVAEVGFLRNLATIMRLARAKPDATAKIDASDIVAARRVIPGQSAVLLLKNLTTGDVQKGDIVEGVSTKVEGLSKAAKPAGRPAVVQRAANAMRDMKSEQVIVLHKVGFRKELEITDKGIRTKKLDIPYSLIKECNCYILSGGVPDKCGVKYTDQSGLDKHVEFGGRALEIYSDILRISKQHGHKIPQQAPGKLLKWATRLRALNVESEFVEPEVEYNRQGDKHWQRDLGGLKFSGSNMDTVRVREQGEIEILPPTVGSPGSAQVHTLYRLTCIIQIQPLPHIVCRGRPVTKWPRRTVDYCWEDGKLARILNEDSKLRKMLIKAKAPSVEVKGNHVDIQGKKFPSLKLFQCIDTIAGYVRKEANR